jgi:flavodoxin
MADLGVLTSQNPIQIEPPSTPTHQYTSGLTSSFNIRSSPSINRDIEIDNSPFLPTTSTFDPNLNISSLNEIFSSDLLNTTTNTTTGPGRNIYCLPKQANIFTPSRPNKTIRFSTIEPIINPDLASAKILQVYDLLVEVYSATKSYDKQAQILDLIEIFREYTESGKLQKVTNQLASQVNNLEHAIRKIEAKTKAASAASSANIAILKNPSKNQTNSTITITTPAISSVNLSSGPTFASVVLAGADSTPGNWTIVNKASKKAKVQNRLILIRESETPFSVLALRNTINKAFLDKSIKGPVVSSITTTSNKKNLVVISTNPFTSDFLIEKRAIWEYLITFKSILKDELWYKVVLHGIPTLDFNISYGIELVVDELKTFNSNLNLKPISTPY